MKQKLKKRAIKKILLIEPPKTISLQLMERARPTVQPPIGLAYIAATLEKNGYEVKILDAIIEDPLCAKGSKTGDGIVRFGLNDAEIEKRIREFNPDVTGVSAALSIKYNDAKNIVKIVKKINPECITIMGGAHPSLRTESVLEDSNLDFIVIGEGDISCFELIQYIEGKRSLESLDGIAMKINGEIKIIPQTRFIEDLDELPFPARHLLPIKKYWEVNLPHGEATRTPWMTLITSRGCPASCIYCSAPVLWGKKYRARSASNVLEEIKTLIETYGIKELLIEDDNFTANKKRTEEILDGIINNKWDITWSTPNGIAIFALDKNLLEKIKKSGCSSITLAVETGSQRVLSQIVRKPLKLEKAEEITKEAKDIGLKTKAFFMLGIPGETKEEMEETLKMARKLKVDWSCFSIATPLPGTVLYDLCKKKKYIEGDIDPTKIEYTTARINTEEFDNDYVNNKWNEANNINFLENPNLMKGGNVDQAIIDFKRVIRMVPNHELAHLYLGIAYEKKNMTKDAIKEWELVLKENKKNELAQKHLAKYGSSALCSEDEADR